ncbi:ribonuclease R [Persicitalea jodogahamensis]|uniref:ribonuclease R n=1 Tax=Persicitalea jodogahamensis TaxID=402147 RepID=UPI0016766209|nr:ribonuclease R [Persicitalea jodogahamensis]
MRSKKQPQREPKEKKPSSKSSHDLLSFVDKLKTEVAAFFETNEGETFRAQEVHDHFGAQDKKLRNLLNDTIHELEEEGKLRRHSGNTYGATAATPDAALVGKVDHVNRNFAFVIIDGRDDDIYVETENLKGAMDTDIVRLEVTRDGGGRDGKRTEGRVVEVLERGRPEVVGVIEIWPKYALVEPDHRKIYDPIHIPIDEIGGANDGEKVIALIEQWPSRTRKPEGRIIEVLGKAGENNAEMHAILAEFGLPIHFPKHVEREAEAIPDKIPQKEIENRRDMREVATFTIDPADAKDFDDALSVQYLENGNVEIGIHIADVSYYVRPDTELEKEAYLRATSVYLVDRTVPMLPEKLSNGLCSLRPNEDRLAFSAVFEMTTKGKLVGEWFGRTVIHSDRRFSYEEAQEVIETGAGDYPEILTLLNNLAKTLRKERFRKGAINFETVEVKFRLDENGKPLGIYQKERKDSNKLIEEFMLLANRRVAEFVYKLSKGKNKNTMVYRVHEAPDPEKLKSFATFVAKLGYKVETDEEKEIARSMNHMLEEVEGKPEQNLVESLAVRTMAKARYTTEDLGHFGLAFRRYSHFTSPIRRYPDVMAHRLLQHYLDGGASPKAEPYDEACKHSSERERMAAEAERASIKYKQVEYMSMMDHSQEFDGIITGVTDFGIFVEITATASEGLIRISDLDGDYYELDKENYRLIGQRTKKIYTFGDSVKVKVKDTNLARRSMDLLLADSPDSHSRSRRNEAAKSSSPRGNQRSIGATKQKKRAGSPVPMPKKKGGGRRRRK